MKFIDRIKAPTPRKNKILGKISTVLCAVALGVAESGVVDNKPVIKIALEVIGGGLGIKATYHAQKVLK